VIETASNPNFEFLQGLQEERENPIHVEVRVGSVGQNPVGASAGRDLTPLPGIDNDGFHIGLADIEYCDFHGIMPYGRR
jgi:hypothetical protein